MSTDDGDLRLDDLLDADERPAAPVWQRAALAVVAVAYLVTAVQAAFTVIGDLYDWAADNAWNWPGDTPSLVREHLQADLLGLTRRSACIAAIGLVLGLWWRRRLATWVSGALVGATLVVGLGMYWLAGPHEPARPAWDDDRPRGCVEYSGEPSDCP